MGTSGFFRSLKHDVASLIPT